jgi:hypothetical protein
MTSESLVVSSTAGVSAHTLHDGPRALYYAESVVPFIRVQPAYLCASAPSAGHYISGHLSTPLHGLAP